MIFILTILIVWKITYNYAHKRGMEECERQSYGKGFKMGVKSVEEEIRELSKLPDKEILQRIHKFAKED